MQVRNFERYIPLTHVCQLEVPTLLNWTIPFPFYCFFSHFYSNFDRKFCKQTVATLIRRHILFLHCLPIKMMQGVYG